MNDRETIEKAIRSVSLPGYVRRVLFELYNDSTGDPAVLVRVIVADDVIQTPSGDLSPDFDWQAIDGKLFDAIWHSGAGRWPYITYRSQSEHDALTGEPLAYAVAV
jgi:hypothetical protein